jgi:molybdopterin-guanine dinucleotide biosynthesis protein A
VSKESHPLTGSALILGGGRGTRIGYDKKKLELGGVSVLDRLAAQLQMVFAEVLISSNEPVTLPGIPVLPDRVGQGPMAGIYQGLLHCISEYLYVVACDMPFINVGYISYMRELIAKEGMDVCIARHSDGGLELFNSFYKKSCAALMGEALVQGEYKIRLVFDRLKVYEIDDGTLQKFDDGSMFFNINYQEDLEQAEQKGRLTLSPGADSIENHGRHK